MVKINNDKYYTPEPLAKRLIDMTFDVLEKHHCTIADIVEPSAGSGAFSTQMKCTAYDILPQHPSIIQADFLTLDLPYKKGRLCIGNPPFGTRNTMSVKFYKKACSIGDYIAFIQPISQLNNNLQMYEFDLIYSEDLGKIQYSDRILHCCFNIYIRPTNGINPRPRIELNDVTIKEYRRPAPVSNIPPGWDYAFCNWGNGSFGNEPTHIGEYAQEVYVYIHNDEKRKAILELLERSKIRAYAKSIAGMKMSKARIYQYLQSNLNLN